MSTLEPRILYCHCAYTKILPDATRRDVLKALGDAGVSFDAVADLCEMSARKDPSLARLCGGGDVRIAACYPRAVKWLFHAAGAPLPERGATIHNMRVDSAADVVAGLLREEASA
jgi:hypothetical protein